MPAKSLPVLSFIVLALAGGCSKPAADAPVAGRPTGPQKQAVEVTPAVRRDLAETLTVVGSLAPNESAEIRPETSGLVRNIYFDEGQRVNKGHVLLKIDDSELRAQAQQVEARFKLAELNVARSEALSQSKTIPQSEFDRARTEFATTRAELAVLRLRIEKTEIKAPFDGIVGSRSISEGDYITTQAAVTRINDLSRLKIDFQVPERFLGKVRQGTTFTVKARSVDASAPPLKGEVYFVSSVIDRNTRSSEVKGFLSDPPEQLKPGMFANVELVLDVRKQVLTVPEGAILTSVNGTQIIAVKTTGQESTAEFIPVSLGLRARGYVEISPLKGELAPQQAVVASGVGGLILFPGAKLEPKPLKAEFKLPE